MVSARQRPAIAIFGGTFDPIHLGHLRSAEELRERLALDEIRLLPCHRPPHRDTPDSDSRHRLAMVQLAVGDTPGLVVDALELEREAPSYSVETLRQCRQQLGDEPALCWVMGSDAFNGLQHWWHWRELFELAHVLVLQRPDHPLAPAPEVAAFVAGREMSPAQLRDSPAGGLLTLMLRQWPVSATAVREALARGADVSRWLPAGVEGYIREHTLYGCHRG